MAHPLLHFTPSQDHATASMITAVQRECEEKGQKKRLALWLAEEDVCGPDPSRMDEDVPIYAFAKVRVHVVHRWVH